jgi:hypothetical protein
MTSPSPRYNTAARSSEMRIPMIPAACSNLIPAIIPI